MGRKLRSTLNITTGQLTKQNWFSTHHNKIKKNNIAHAETGSIVGKMLLECHLWLAFFMSGSIVPKVVHYYRMLQTGFEWPFSLFEKHHLVVFYWPLSPPPPPSSCDWWNCPRQSSSANRGRGIVAQVSSLGVPVNGWVATARFFPPPPPPPLPNWDYRTRKLPLCWKAAFAQRQLVATERGH